MFSSGLVSISFRKFSPLEIVKLVSSAQLCAIEWGGDVHVPHGNLSKAEEVRGLTLDHGLELAGYGSYYRAGKGDQEFEPVLETAVTLGAPSIRVWAGTISSSEAVPEDTKRVTDDLRRIAELAASAGISVSLEYHSCTLADRLEPALSLMKEIAHPNLKTFWQPGIDRPVEVGLQEIAAFVPDLSAFHVFHWINRYERRPLEEGRDLWSRYFAAARQHPGRLFALLEFIMDDSPENFLKDAETLRRLLQEAWQP